MLWSAENIGKGTHEAARAQALGRGAKVLNIETGVRAFVDAMTLSPDGKKLVLGFRLGHLLAYDPATGAKVYDSRRSNPTRSAVISADGKRIVSASGSKVIVWNGSPSLRALEGHSAEVSSVAISPDGKRIVSASTDEATVRLWDARTGTSLPGLAGQPGAVNEVAFSPDGTRLGTASADDATVRIWDAQTGTLVRALRSSMGGSGHGVVFSPDGKHIASKSEFVASVMNVETGAVDWYDSYKNPVYGLAFLTNDKLLLGNNADQVYVQQFGSTTSKRAFDVREPHAIAVSPDGNLIASGQLALTHVSKDYVTSRFNDGGLYPVTALAFSPKSDLVLSASRSGMLRLWQAKDGALLVKLDLVPGKETGYVITPNGEMDFLGPDACFAREVAVCRIGGQVVPFEVCEDRAYAPGLLDRVLAGANAALEPEVPSPSMTCAN